MVGGCHYDGFMTDMSTLGAAPTVTLSEALGQLRGRLADPLFWVHGLWYSLTILAILGCHEMGHYVMCLRYNVDATRPYFLPAPLPLTGTLGAFIRLRSRIPSKIALFDIGIAGPIAGFVIAVPALFVGLMMSRHRSPADDLSRFDELGEPLLFQFAAWLIWGDVPDGMGSTCTRWRSRRGSACWPPRSICFRSASSTAATSPTPCSGAGRPRSPWR